MIDFKSYFHDKYQGGEDFIENVILPIFGEDKYEDAYEEDVLENNPELTTMASIIGISQVLRMGTINIPMNPTDVFDITVNDHVQMERNRVAIQSLVRRIMSTYSSAFMVFHYDDDTRWDWRFTFCSKKGNNQESTDSKRYTFLLGPNQSCRTAAENFKKLADKRGEIELEDIVKAFDVESLSKEFFEKYKVRYGRFVGYVIGKEYVDKGEGKGEWREKEGLTPSELFYGLKQDEKRVRDYIKKLLGRIVFLHFLQKKGWLGATDEEWTNGPQDFMLRLFDKASADQQANFLDEILEPLFSCLDTPLNERREVFDTKVDGLRSVRVPFLGGLFERTEEDKAISIFPADLFADLFKFLSEYNFTIDENDPNDAQVGVDPEMLGRIFENLLEDNKDKGAFYTPKEIVQYMCRESLIAYLQTDVTDEATREALRQFVTTHDVNVLGGKESPLALNVSQCLKDVKICDPAIGSGAFPMGLLNELFLCRGVIEDFANAAAIKRHIIQQNIYGVDIEKGAVEIARLRFWLSLITDADTPEVLPNMDFKIMQGNSLLEQYKGFDLSHIMDSKKKVEGPIQMTIFENDVDELRRQLIALRNEYYKATSSSRKETLRIEMRRIVQAQIDTSINQYVGKYGDKKSELVQIEHLDIAVNDQFFLWHTWFSEVFEKGGFDIVIGNPPYFVYEGNNKGEIATLKKIPHYKIALGGKLNAYKLFLAHALNCLVKKLGTTCFIFQNSFMADLQAANLREYVLKNCQILSIDSFPERDSKKKRVFESVKMSVCILLVRNQKTAAPFIVNIWDDKNKTSGTLTSFKKSEIDIIDGENHSIPRIAEELKPIIIKMLKLRHYSIKCNEGELNVTSHRPFFSTDSSLPVIMKGAGIQRYFHTYKMSQGNIEYLKEKEYLEALGTSDKAQHHCQRRIVMQGMTGANDKIRLVMTIVPEGMYLGHSCKYIMPIEDLPLECILAIMNSKLANTFFRCFSTNSNVNGYEIEYIPISEIDTNTQLIISEKVKVILSSKALDPHADTSSLEHEIDLLVYDLYGLTKEERLIVDPDYKE